MEFYYQGALRWAYGFENPNKAAALIASLLPFCSLLLFFTKRTWRSWSGWLVVAIFLGGWFLLIKTYSRGGVVAAVISQSYMAWHFRRQIAAHWRMAVLIVATLTVMFTVSGLGARHVESVGDASVHNRFALWKGGLTMLADMPSGVGTGNSGRVYMDWYQSLTATEGYRTLVNSYLTFATEQGLAVFGGCLIMCGVFWQLVNPQIDADGRRFFLIKVVVCGSLLAFLTAGFFSTTMESPVLWIPPLMAGLLLAWVFWRNETNWTLIAKQSVTGVSLAVLAVLLIYGLGCYFGSQEDLERQFHFKGGELVSAQLRSKRAAKAKSMALWVDHEVLGNEYGKALRQILAQCLASKMEVYDANAEGASDAQWLVYCGSQCVLPKENDRQRVVWMMPSLAALEKLEAVLPTPPYLKVITSRRLLERGSGRVLENLNRKGRLLALGGAEKNVLWYWDEILNSGILGQAE